MRKTIGAAVASAVLCVLALAGCGAGNHGGAGISGANAAKPTATPAANTGAQPGADAGADGVPPGTPTGAAAVDSELNSVDQQLGAADTDLAQATAQPSDGD
ncbi:hypothetical protein [Actinospica robiniae]|uniref:hypothetical protein n=1 Tax=Actinospica robiniae TaxID=304901 RepID=UPI000404FA1B|nr:hypothetical protein [Actinospica robiniae]